MKRSAAKPFLSDSIQAQPGNDVSILNVTDYRLLITDY